MRVAFAGLYLHPRTPPCPARSLRVPAPMCPAPMSLCPLPADLGLPAINFVPNGASGPHEWRGEVADLRLGLQAAAAATGASGRPACCVACLSCSLAFMPGYNLQRLLEHSYLRGRDVLGCSLVNGVDLALEGSEVGRGGRAGKGGEGEGGEGRGVLRVRKGDW